MKWTLKTFLNKSTELGVIFVPPTSFNYAHYCKGNKYILFSDMFEEWWRYLDNEIVPNDVSLDEAINWLLE